MTTDLNEHTWPQAFSTWLEEECIDHEVSVLSAAWVPSSHFMAEVIVEGRMKGFYYRPPDWERQSGLCDVPTVQRSTER